MDLTNKKSYSIIKYCFNRAKVFNNWGENKDLGEYGDLVLKAESRYLLRS